MLTGEQGILENPSACGAVIFYQKLQAFMVLNVAADRVLEEAFHVCDGCRRRLGRPD